LLLGDDATCQEKNAAIPIERRRFKILTDLAGERQDSQKSHAVIWVCLG
jgi:hypothetical protein